MIKSENIIEAVGLKKYYRRGSEVVKALDGFDFRTDLGAMVAVVGPSSKTDT